MNYFELIENMLIGAGVDKNAATGAVTRVSESGRGDFCFACFKLAKEFKKAPNIIAAELALQLKNDAFCQIRSDGGYVNFFLNRAEFAKNMLENKVYELEQTLKGKTIVIDYSSINIAKPFHIGHLMSTAIGGSLYRIFSALGAKTVGINHLGDYGTQFGKLVCAYKLWGNEYNVEQDGLNALLALYVRFHDEAEKNPKLNDEGRRYFKLIEDGDSETVGIFNLFRQKTLESVEKVYKRLGIVFDSYNGESFFNDKVQPVVDALSQKGLLKLSDGAQIVELDELGLPPCLITRSDGASLYATRDLAAAIYRKNEYDFDKCLYVVAYQQNLHFQQVFAVLKKMGLDFADDCVHIPFGMVSLADGGTLSSRKGNVVFLNDVLNTAVLKTLDTINSKNPALESKEQIAESVGVGAVVFAALANGKIKDMVFSYDKVLEFEGETGPYVMYTHARCCSIIKKVNADLLCGVEVDASAICDDNSFALLKQLSCFGATVADAAQRFEPSMITRLLVDIAQEFNKFYLSCRILGEEPRVAASRLALVRLTQKTLERGLNLILLDAPEQM